MHNSHPLRRPGQLTTQPVGDETLVYDERVHKAYCLNRVTAAVWLYCDGEHSVREIAGATANELSVPVTDEIVCFALSELNGKGLLQQYDAAAAERLPSRRELIRKLGLGAAVLLPLITAIDVPKAPGQSVGGGCVLPQTPILLADGSVLPAAAVAAGQWLKGFDPVSGTIRAGCVKSVHPCTAPRIYTLFTEGGETLQASPSHLLLSSLEDRNGRPLQSFRSGDEILAVNDRGQVAPTRLSGITTIDMPQRVIGFEMDTREHTLITAGVVSHNYNNKDLPEESKQRGKRAFKSRN